MNPVQNYDGFVLVKHNMPKKLVSEAPPSSDGTTFLLTSLSSLDVQNLLLELEITVVIEFFSRGATVGVAILTF